MTKLSRSYSIKTLKVLFALSGNQCAYPECTNNLIEQATKESDVLVTGHICHIYAVSEDGPRGKSGLTNKELNSPENLILLCRNHHAIVDGQYQTYPADMLREWKRSHELKMQKQLSGNLGSIRSDIFSHPYFPKALVDQKIKDEVDILRKSRFFPRFDRVGTSLSLARKITEGDLFGGTDEIKSRALAWCARILSATEESNKAKEYLKIAKSLGTNTETEIAQAFINSQYGDKRTALSALANIDSPVSRSAALMIVSHHNGPQEAIHWLMITDIDVANLDPDGKYFYFALLFQIAHWDTALGCLNKVTEDDMREAPILNHTVAITHLLRAVPNELRHFVLTQIPFEAATFRLASDTAAIDARRAAHRHFINAEQAARQLNCPVEAMIDDVYALWLELRDPDEFANGMQRLKTNLRDYKFALHLVPLAIQFGIKLDLEKVEREIERQKALHGGITPDAAIARFAIALTHKTPESVANYIARYRDELAKYIDNKLLLSLEIEMLSKAGLLESAKNSLELLMEEGLSEEEENRLRRIIAEAEGADSIDSRKEQYLRSGNLIDLVSLVEELETRQEWETLCEYSQILFEETHSLPDAVHFATALYNTHKTKQLVEYFEANPDFLTLSDYLRLLYCWTLYNEGALTEARSELSKFNDDWNNPNYRELKINLAIASGDWNSLLVMIAHEYSEQKKQKCSGSNKVCAFVNVFRLTLRQGFNICSGR